MSLVEFEIIYDDILLNISSDKVCNNKFLLSLTNGFESGKWRSEIFYNFIFDNITETALSASEREALILKPHSALTNAAKNIRLSEKEEGGEIGEILLYGLLRKHYGALPIVPKIFYKQSSGDYAKGADSVHVVLDDKGEFTLWLGEAKFNDCLDTSRLDKIVESVSNLLSSKKMRKELTIVTSLQEIDLVCPNKNTVAKIKAKLDNGVSLDDIKEILHVPILMLHECPITAKHKTISSVYKKELLQYHSDIALQYIKKQHNKISSVFNFEKIVFHLILFPVPQKDEIVQWFTKKVRFYGEHDAR